MVAVPRENISISRRCRNEYEGITLFVSLSKKHQWEVYDNKDGFYWLTKRGSTVRLKLTQNALDRLFEIQKGG